MKSETVERVTEWDSEPFSGGHAGLREFADREFTGAVTDGGAWLFMLNGRVLGVFDGGIDRFADADGTAYVAPDRSLPLLFAMRETAGEVRGEYYTEETPLSEVDRTLQSGNFTGYVELSENVLSGDYFLAYYGGRRMPVAFVGNQKRRLTGDEAYERAADEVGIYRVKTVNVEIVDVPEPAGAGDSAAAGGATTVDDDDGSADQPSPAEEDATAGSDGQESTTGTEFATAPSTDSEAPAQEETEAAPSSDGHQSAAESRRYPTPTDSAGAGSAPAAESASAEPERAATEAAEAAMANGADTATTNGADAATADSTDATAMDSANDRSEGTPSQSGSASRFEGESEWRETTTIPALDPSESVSMEAASESAEPPASESTSETASTAEPEPASSETVTALREERDQLQERVEELEAETDRLRNERDRLERERDDAAATADELETEVAELRATVDELESELRGAEAELEAAQEYLPEGDHEVPPEEAIAGTSLFVRYERKGGPTLEDAHNGDADREAVNDNLRLEHHTEFDDDGAIVDGEPFEAWLRTTVEYEFVEWLTRSLLHDVRETRNQTAMGKLYGAIPEIDRIEFRGSVELGEEAEEESASFDIVLRDRMGQPLIVTDLNSSREPATEPMLESLLRNATPVGETNEQLAAAFFVTSSYYEPGALETAEGATGGGFLGRGKHKSFVKLSRKDGYHLSLVETRDGEFHVSVPEL